jgi:hypothetical protein
VEHATWMNEEIRPEIEDLRGRYGFEEDEALAFWHIRQAGGLMNEMRRSELHQEIARHEGQDDEVAFRQITIAVHTARWHTTVWQHVIALHQVLGNRVLRRHYPEGWGGHDRMWGSLERIEDAEEG